MSICPTTYSRDVLLSLREVAIQAQYLPAPLVENLERRLPPSCLRDISFAALNSRNRDDQKIIQSELTEGVKILFELAKRKKRSQELLHLLKPNYPALFACLLSNDVLAICGTNSVDNGHLDDEHDWRLLLLLRGNLYSKVDPHEILPYLERHSYLSQLESERIRESNDRMLACLELVTVLARHRRAGSYLGLLQALFECGMRQVAETIDPDCRIKIAKMKEIQQGVIVNDLSRKQNEDDKSATPMCSNVAVAATAADSASPIRGPSGQHERPGNVVETPLATTLQVAVRTEDHADNAATMTNTVGRSEVTDASESVTDSGDVDIVNSSQLRISLRPYQKEVADPALRGLNCVICMPTNSGKTVVAAHVIKEHLENTENACVAFVAPKVALVNQQYEFIKTYLGNRYKVCCITGSTPEAFRLRHVATENNVLVLTPQILVNALAGVYSGADNSPSSRVDSLGIFTLLILDECHNCVKASPYSTMMSYYVRDKLKGQGPLPQVVGLTATLGVGDANSETAASEHILKICANLACEQPPKRVLKEIESLREYVNVPIKERHPVPDRHRNEFSSILLKAMNYLESMIVEALDGIPSGDSYMSGMPTDRLKQAYQQWIDTMTKDSRQNLGNYPRQLQVINICLSHLKVYWVALDIWQNARHKDAYRHLLNQEDTRCTETAVAAQAETLHRETMQQLNALLDVQDDNPRLDELAKLIRSKFSPSQNNNDRGLIFVQTRELTRALCEWIEELDGGAFKHVKPTAFTGVHASADKGGLTSSQQEDVLKSFRAGTTRLLVCTSVADEGLDIPECKFCVLYLRSGDMISSIQARGRVRAAQGVAHIISSPSRSRKEELHFLQETLMEQAMENICAMDVVVFKAQIAALQQQTMREKEIAELNAASQPPKAVNRVQMRCGRCNEPAVSDSGLRVFKEAHHIVTDLRFEERIVVLTSTNVVIGYGMVKDKKIGCKNCKKDWGIGMTMGGCGFYVIKLDPFVVETQDGTRRSYKKWKDFPFHLEPIEEAELIELGRQKIVNVEQ